MISLNKTITIISILAISGCCTECPKSGMAWNSPPTPIKKHVEFKDKNGELFLDKTNSVNLLYNINEMQAYQKNLETLVATMKKYYDAK